ncbi:unnamed protein product [Rotaria sp. Silwood1]|nr:unnamed protein product [Rotaria sp. Silwood1]
MASFIPKSLSTNNQSVNPLITNQSHQFTVYIVADGNQVQLVEIPDYVKKPVIFRNKIGKILRSTCLPAMSIGHQPVIVPSETNRNSFILFNSSRTNFVQQQQTSTTSLARQQQLYQNFSQTTPTTHTNSLVNIQQKNSTNATLCSTSTLNEHKMLKTYDSDISSIYNDNNSSSYDISDDSITTTTIRSNEELNISPINNSNETLNNNVIIKKERDYPGFVINQLSPIMLNDDQEKNVLLSHPNSWTVLQVVHYMGSMNFGP